MDAFSMIETYLTGSRDDMPAQVPPSVAPYIEIPANPTATRTLRSQLVRQGATAVVPLVHGAPLVMLKTFRLVTHPQARSNLDTWRSYSIATLNRIHLNLVNAIEDIGSQATRPTVSSLTFDQPAVRALAATCLSIPTVYSPSVDQALITMMREDPDPLAGAAAGTSLIKSPNENFNLFNVIMPANARIAKFLSERIGSDPKSSDPDDNANTFCQLLPGFIAQSLYQPNQ